jgi:hypothetical protein
LPFVRVLNLVRIVKFGYIFLLGRVTVLGGAVLYFYEEPAVPVLKSKLEFASQFQEFGFRFTL